MPAITPIWKGTFTFEIDDTEPTPEPTPTPTTDFNCECADENDAKTLSEYREDMMIGLGFAAQKNNPPPGMTDLLNFFLQRAQAFLYKRYPALRTRRFFRWTMSEGVRYYGIRDNDENATEATVTITIASPGVVTWTAHGFSNGQRVRFTTTGALPTGLTAGVEYFIVSAATDTFRVALTAGGTAINTSGTQSGVHTGIGPAPAACSFFLDPYKTIEGVWIVDLNGAWIPMGAGIPATWYTTVAQQGIPARYEIRQCLEVFPAPNVDGYQLYIKGHFGQRSFTEDTDKPSIDGDLLFEWALARAKKHYGAVDADATAAAANTMLKDLVAGTHLNKRYIPGTIILPPAIAPLFLPLVS